LTWWPDLIHTCISRSFLRRPGAAGVPFDTILSTDETYAGITPVRLDSNGVTAFISIMRGCENHCSYCVVPSTRGVERSMDAGTILSETRDLFEKDTAK